MTTDYLPPDDPADPVAAALTHLILEPETTGITTSRTELQQLAALLDAADAFAGLCWCDAMDAAGIIAYNVADGRPARQLADLAATVRAGGTGWSDPARAARLFTIAAECAGTL